MAMANSSQSHSAPRVERDAHHTAMGAVAPRNSAVQSGLPVVVKIRQRPDSCTGRPTIQASGSMFAACRHAWQAINNAATATALSSHSKFRGEPALRDCRADRSATKNTIMHADKHAQPKPRCSAGLRAYGATMSGHDHSASAVPVKYTPGGVCHLGAESSRKHANASIVAGES